MSNSENTSLSPIKLKSLTKKKLAKLISVIDAPQSKKIRHLDDKILFIKALCCDESLTSSINKMPELLIGPLLYMSSDKRCQYSYSYFKTKLSHFKKIINVWDDFLENVANCIAELPDLIFDTVIEVRINGFLQLIIQQENILFAKIDIANLDNLYAIKEGSFYYEVLLTKGELIYSDFDPSGTKLKETFKNLNALYEHQNILGITLQALYHNELI